MNSTKQILPRSTQLHNKTKITNRFIRYPDLTGQRKVEGGARIHGKLKSSSKNQPLVTIITVCLNSENTIEQCIQSVLEQTYNNVEYILIDGCSSDRTLEIIKNYSSVIDYYISEPDQGLYHAMNKGLELANGDYILILNSDDWYESDCVQTLVKAKDYSGCDFVGSLARYIDEKTERDHVFRSMPYNASCLFRMPLRHETLLLSSEIYNQIGFYDQEYNIISDRCLVQKLYSSGYKYYEVPRPLLNFRTSGVSNQQRDKLYSERKKILKKSFEFVQSNDIKKLAGFEPLSYNEYRQISLNYSSNPLFLSGIRAYFCDNIQYEEIGPAIPSISWEEIWNNSGLPEVSVILPVYNAEKKISNALDSIVSQSFSNFEVICINDRSPDNSQGIIEQYAKLDKRIKPYINVKNIGHGASRNRGVSLANGIYIFHIDPDDTLPKNALELLVDCAKKHKSQLVKGAFATIDQNGETKYIRYPCGKNIQVINTNLKETPELLHSTEGHWSILYDKNIAESVPYPSDLKMGQDSIFLVNVLSRAHSISFIPNVVYNYHANPQSAMNTFNARKYCDDIEWRRRAWHVLNDFGYKDIGDYILQTYWYEPFIRKIPDLISELDQRKFISQLAEAFKDAGYDYLSKPPSSEFLKSFFNLILNGREDDALKLVNEKKVDSLSNNTCGYVRIADEYFEGKYNLQQLKVLTLSTLDTGGAGIAARRFVNSFQKGSVKFKNYAILVKNPESEFEKIDCASYKNINWADIETKTIVTKAKIPTLRAREIFSNTESFVDFKQQKHIFENVDLVHLHWVVGMFDYQNAGGVLANKPLIWTLHDMNPFTGGCHYSEGCEGYIHQCKDCPLLGGNSELAHNNWKIKKEAYSNLKNLTIVSPSRWLADCARKSSLFGDKQIHVIENSYPVDVFKPVNKTVARLKLKLPLNKKLILFGADYVTNLRKGGDILQEVLSRLADSFSENEISLVYFGHGSIKTNIPTFEMGKVGSESQLSLIYSAADVLIFASREDNAPLTIGESLLCGTPVVSFPVGTVPELITHEVNGYIAEYGSADSLAKGVVWALNDADWRNKIKRSLQCRIHAAKTLAHSTISRYYLKLYHSNVPSSKIFNGLPEQSKTIYIITPCLNAGDTIDETIASVIQQAGDFRIVYHVQDGGSSDKTLDILRGWEYKLRSKSVKINCHEIIFSWKTESDSGMYDAITRAFASLNFKDDDLLTWVNGDDLLLPNALSIAVKISKQMLNVSWIGAPTYNILNNGQLNCFRLNPTPTEVIREGLCDGGNIHWPHLQQEGTFFKGWLWNKSKHVLSNYRLAGDWALWKEFARYAKYYQADKPLGAFRIRPGQLSSGLRDKYDAEIDGTVSRKDRNLSYNRLYDKRRSLVCNFIQISSDNEFSVIVEDDTSARNYFYKKGEIKEILSPLEKQESDIINVSPFNFDFFTYAKNNHWPVLKKYDVELYGEPVEPSQSDLKRYQDLLAYVFIKKNIKPGSRILEVGGGNSRILSKLSSTYECWLVDKLEGVGNGPKQINMPNVKLIRDYIGSFNVELPDNYFDFVFSISVLEHVPQGDNAVLRNIIDDMNRVLRQGGYSLHLFDVVFKDGKPKEFSKLINMMFEEVVTTNVFRDPLDIQKDNDIYYLNGETYDRIWKKYTKKSYSEFGSPTSYNILWIKQ